MSIVADLWQKLRRKKAEVHQRNQLEWRQFVIDVTDGIEADEEGILIALDQLGKSPEELQAASDSLIERRGLKSQIDHALTLERDIPALEDQIRRLDVAFEAAEEKYRSDLVEPQQKIGYRKNLLVKVAPTKLQLIKSAGPEYQDRISQLRGELQLLYSELSHATRLVDAQRKLVGELAPRPAPVQGEHWLGGDVPRLRLGTPEQHEARKEEDERHLTVRRQQLSELEGKCSAKQAEIGMKEQQIKSFEESLLDPNCF